VSSIDLNDHLGNKDGKFVTGSNHFIYTATNIRMDGNSPVLLAQMKNYDHDYVDASIDLSTCITNNNGILAYNESQYV